MITTFDNMRDEDPLFVMLVGLPAAGKSTFRAAFGGEFAEISSDDLIEQYAREQGKTYNDVFTDTFKDRHTAMQLAATRARDRRVDIMWDQTNLGLKKRQKLLTVLPKEYIKIAVYFEIDEGVRQDRMAQRVGKTIPEHVDAKMILSYVRPTYDEGFDFVLDGLVDFE